MKRFLMIFMIFSMVLGFYGCTLDADKFTTVTTFAGQPGVRGYQNGNVSGGNAANVLFAQPEALAMDASGHLLIGDSGNKAIRRILLSGPNSGRVEDVVTVGIAGDIRGMAVDSGRNIIISDHHAHKIKKFDSNGVLIGEYGSNMGYLDGPGDTAMFNFPAGVAVDSNDNIYVADTYNNRVRKIDTAGNVSTFAGSTKDYAEGQGAAAKFKEIVGVAVDSKNNIIVADTWNHCIRFLDPEGNSGMYASHRGSWGFQDGESAQARVGTPQFLFFDRFDNLYFTDAVIMAVRTVTPGRTVPAQPIPGNPNLAKEEPLPTGSPNVTLGPGDNWGPDKVVARFVYTLAGYKGFSNAANHFIGHGYRDGNNNEALFNKPRGIAVTRNGNTIYVADMDNHVIRRIDR